MKYNNIFDNLEKCECKQWARTGQKFMTQHHPLCSKYDPEGDAYLIIDKLLYAMRYWGSEEDGVPDFAADAYDQAAISIYQKPLLPSSDDKFYNQQQKKQHEKHNIKSCTYKNQHFEEFDLFELPDPNKLETLADWLDLQYPNDKNTEVQCDLRLWASSLRKINENIEYNCSQAEKYHKLHLDAQILELKKIQDQFNKLYDIISELICDYKIPEIEEREDYITEHLTGLKQKIMTIINNKREEYK